MTLKELAALFKQYSKDSNMCDHYKNAWVLDNKNNYHFERLDEEDIIDLRSYLKCYILSFYEYLAIQDGVELDEWFSKYRNEKCNKEDNDIYLGMKELYFLIHGENANSQDLDDSFQIMLDKSIEPFKSRGIPRTCIDDSV